MKIVIIGGGTAGINAATKLRRENEDYQIIILEKNAEFGVANCGLAYYLSGEISKDELITTDAQTLSELFNVDVRLNSEVTAINREEQSVTINNKDKEYYDKLIFTIGAYQTRPDIEGVLSEQVFTLYDLNSVERIKRYIEYNEVRRAVIVGGGYIGVEMAEALAKLNIEVMIVEKSSHILPIIDEDMATTIQNAIRKRGVEIFVNKTVLSFDDNRLTLSDGISHEYDLAIITTGVKPDLKLSVLAELDIGETGGLVVNEHLQTSDKNIYAAGDDVEIIDLVTRKPIRRSEVTWAIKEAQVIAEHIAGEDAEFKYGLSSAIVKVFDYEIGMVGANENELKKYAIEYDKILIYGASQAGYLKNSNPILFKLIFNKSGEILGAQGIGNSGIDKRIDILSMAIGVNAKVEDLQRLEIAYSPPFGTPKDVINTVATQAVNVLNDKVKFVNYEDIDWQNLTGEQVIIDVRPQAQFAKAHIPNAINIPVEGIRNNLTSIPREKMVILYCNRGYRAYIASCILTNRGFGNIYLLNGSFNLYNQIIENNQNSLLIN